jgi:hypothetical protein
MRIKKIIFDNYRHINTVILVISAISNSMINQAFATISNEVN